MTIFQNNVVFLNKIVYNRNQYEPAHTPLYKDLSMTNIYITPALSFSVGEWEIYLTDNSSFIFYGMEKFINYIPPAKLSALNIPGKSSLRSNMYTLFQFLYLFLYTEIHGCLIHCECILL